ncbi:hypothetical protein TRSC58_07658 [Trypanosoma rangeli SC58]|uniref:Uncharacterized protein n=1 Tax=Trypanosoma rangeli SC58 TaxID=429131 RepID=A0A061ISR4_TRYRA|nr:hypothetical protein TRSC58_07658 [Trypanosoma rangeli SC58]
MLRICVPIPRAFCLVALFVRLPLFFFFCVNFAPIHACECARLMFLFFFFLLFFFFFFLLLRFLFLTQRNDTAVSAALHQ